MDKCGLLTLVGIRNNDCFVAAAWLKGDGRVGWILPRDNNESESEPSLGRSQDFKPFRGCWTTPAGPPSQETRNGRCLIYQEARSKGLMQEEREFAQFLGSVLKQHCYQGPQQIGTWQVLNSKEESGSLCCWQQDWSERLIINCMFSFLYYSLDGYLSLCIIMNKLFLYKLVIFITVFDVLVHGFYTG